jgi:cell wall-associated NlpC family hydrolase
MIDYSDLLGVQFAYRGRGPDEYDCYGLLIELYRRLGKDIPDYISPTKQEAIALLIGEEKVKWKSHWKRSDSSDVPPSSVLIPGRTLLFNIGRYGSHVGMIIRPRYFLHIWEGSGCVERQPISSWQRRIVGVYDYNDADGPLH